MKSRNKIIDRKADPDEYMQDCSACTYYQFTKKKETKLVFETRQLYATEAEDYFFYFIPIEENDIARIAI